MNIRETLNKNPMIGWALAAVLSVAAVGYALMGTKSEQAQMTEKVTVLFTDTNEEVVMRRGELEMQLLTRVGPVDPNQGIINPKTQVASGVIINKSDWTQTVEKLNAMKRAATAQSGSGGNGNAGSSKK